MGAVATKQKKYSKQENLSISAKGELRYELENGELISMGRTTDIHNGYYLIISQHQVRVDVFEKTDQKKGWKYTYYDSLEETIPLQHPDIELQVKDIYEEVELIPEEPEKEDE